jgi:uncharacterized protein (DUF952 family)
VRIFHVAAQTDWAEAQARGTYTTSTYSRSLADEGFLHASRAEQVAGVLERFYADVDEPLVLLEVDTDLLDVPWREDPVGDDTFPHVYGPLSTTAVVAVRPVS